MMIKTDWTECTAIETVPGKMSGQPVIKGSRVRPEDLLINRDQGVEWLERNHGIPAATIRKVFAFHDANEKHRLRRSPAPA
jgi:uncharacterized protein (DUF433 family)